MAAGDLSLSLLSCTSHSLSPLHFSYKKHSLSLGGRTYISLSKSGREIMARRRPGGGQPGGGGGGGGGGALGGGQWPLLLSRVFLSSGRRLDVAHRHSPPLSDFREALPISHQSVGSSLLIKICLSNHLSPHPRSRTRRFALIK